MLIAIVLLAFKQPNNKVVKLSNKMTIFLIQAVYMSNSTLLHTYFVNKGNS